MSFLDVGQGDATLVQAPGGVAVLFDGGPPEAGVGCGCCAAGVRGLALVVATHQSRDHHGGLQQVVERLPVGTLLENGDGTRDRTFWRVVATAAARGARVVGRGRGRSLAGGPVAIRVSGRRRATGTAARGPQPPRDRRGGLLRRLRPVPVRRRGVRRPGRYALPPVDAMKVSHHGSADPGLPRLLERLRPRVAAIEVGADNTYGHPAPSTLAALRAAGVGVYRTDRDGTVRVGLGQGGGDAVEAVQ